MAEYVCIKELCLDTYDANGFLEEQNNTIIKVGEVFQRSEDDYRLVGDKDSIRLDSDRHWVEIDEKTLNEYFKPQ